MIYKIKVFNHFHELIWTDITWNNITRIEIFVEWNFSVRFYPCRRNAIFVDAVYTLYDFEFCRGGSNTDCFYIPRDEGTRTRKCCKAGGKFAASHQFNQNFLPTIFFPSLPKLVNKVGGKGSPFNLILKRGIGLILSTLKDIGTFVQFTFPYRLEKFYFHKF